MSLRYKGAVISATPPTTTGGESGVASGSWTLEQQFQAQGAGNWPEPFVAKYIEDVFSTYLYTGTGASLTINNGINLSANGGLVWQKDRVSAGTGHYFQDTTRGVQKYVLSNSTAAEVTNSGTITSFNSNGYTVGGNGNINGSGEACVSWTFRKQPKFFDVVTWTADGTTNRQIPHSLGSQPGFITCKRTNSTGNWRVYHRSQSGKYANLEDPGAFQTDSVGMWTDVQPTYFISDYLNAFTGATYVTYLFAHDAGGFGLTGTDNVISCGSAANGNSLVTLGYEPQWVLIKGSQGSSGVGDNWLIADAMRGMVYAGNTPYLAANLSSAENFGGGGGSWIQPTATGFQLSGLSGTGPFIYIAIRRGPMKVPTSGTSVFYSNAVAQADSPDSSNVPFPPDLVSTFSRNGVDRFQSNQFNLVDRLRGLGTPNNTYSASGLGLTSSSINAESSAFPYVQLKADSQNITRGSGWNSASYGNWIYYFFRRAPSFFDEVCYTGTDAVRTINHNLGVAPELIIVKGRNTNPANSSYWTVYAQPTGNTNYMYLDSTNATSAFSGYWNNTSPTASVFTLGTGNGEDTNATGKNYVAYLFATCAGVSKVGSYTGNGSTQTINCGFTGGARFVLIKRTDDAGDWYVYDTARGMTTLTDPYLRLNTTTAEFATLGSVTTVSTGFAVNASILAAINTNGASYIFLAIA